MPDHIWLAPPHLAPGTLQELQACLASGWIAPAGPAISDFEVGLALAMRRQYASALNSGTAAIHLGLHLLGVGAGDVVLCSTLTFVASANPVLYQGATPVFIDSEADSWNMCPEALATALASLDKEGIRPKALVVTHLYGRLAQMDLIAALCEQYGVPILEDAAEALGASFQGRQAGSWGAVSAVSFNGNKVITTGGGGALVTDRADFAEKTQMLATQNRLPYPHHEHAEVGYNYRMSNVLASIGLAQLPMLDAYIEKKRAIYQAYKDRLSPLPGVSFLSDRAEYFDTHWLSTVVINPELSGGITWAKARMALAAWNIESRPIWMPMHLQPLFSGARYFGGTIAETAFANTLCLPSGTSLTADEQDRVCSVLEALWH